MKLRVLLLLQITWIAVVGMMFRGVLDYPDGRIADLILVSALYGMPAVVLAFAEKADSDRRSRWFLVITEVGLSLAYLVALLPGVQ